MWTSSAQKFPLIINLVLNERLKVYTLESIKIILLPIAFVFILLYCRKKTMVQLEIDRLRVHRAQSTTGCRKIMQLMHIKIIARVHLQESVDSIPNPGPLRFGFFSGNHIFREIVDKYVNTPMIVYTTT